MTVHFTVPVHCSGIYEELKKKLLSFFEGSSQDTLTVWLSGKRQTS